MSMIDFILMNVFQTDARVQTVTESESIGCTFLICYLLPISAMNVIRMIKLFGWEPKMNKQIDEKRQEELKFIKTRQLLDVSNGTLKYVTRCIMSGSLMIVLLVFSFLS